jgi:isopropylmalate/homocitrate/citramalate synthase
MMMRVANTTGKDVRVVDVAPRDGLQNESVVFSVEQRAELVRRLYAASVPQIEVGSFVRPDRVPQMAETERVVALLPGAPASPRFAALVPNERGYHRAVETGLRCARAVVATTREFNRRNLGVEPGETLNDIALMCRHAAGAGVTVVATISTAFGCPYEGRVPPTVTVEMAKRLADAGCRELILADTTGMGVPDQVGDVTRAVLAATAPTIIGAHMHNTRNTGYANVMEAIRAGATVIDASLGGIGGCPFAPKATGNIATEDLVHMLERSGIGTGIDLRALLDAAAWLERALGRPLPGLVSKAGPVDPAVYGSSPGTRAAHAPNGY